MTTPLVVPFARSFLLMFPGRQREGQSRVLPVQRRSTLPLLSVRLVYVLLGVVVCTPLARAQCLEQQQSAATSRDLNLRTSRPPAPGPADWIFLIDSSKTMRESHRGLAIIDRVKATLRQFVGAVRDGDTIVIYVFDASSRLVL